MGVGEDACALGGGARARWYGRPLMSSLGIRTALDDACAERARLERDLGEVRARQERLVTEFLDELAPRLSPVARDLRFGLDGARAHGVSFGRTGASPLFVVVTEGSWVLIERHAHGVHAVVKRVPVSALVDAFGADTIRLLESAHAGLGTALEHAPSPPARPVLNGPSPSSRTRPCTECEAEPNEANFARHLRAVHGIVPGAPTRKKATPSHEVCRLCSARLPAGRLDAHMTVAHGIFHVHPHEGRRDAAIRSTRGRSRTSPKPAPSRAFAPATPGRDFLAEARVERTLVARADSPLRNRERGRFSDAPDVERMDGDSEA